MPTPRHLSTPGRSSTRPGRLTALFVLLAAACGLLLSAAARQAGAADSAAAAAETPPTGLVNVNESGVSSSMGASGVSITPDGRYVLFTSNSFDLAPNDTNGGDFTVDVFVRDRRAGRTILVSVNHAGTDSGKGSSFAPVITPDGRYVAFVSGAADLVAPDPGGLNFENVYLRDLLTGQTTLVSQTPAGHRGNSYSRTFGEAPALSISDDGRYVSFISNASDLVAGDNNSRTDAFVRDLKDGVTRLVSVNQTGNASGNEASTYAVLTRDGRFAAFRSAASDLVPNDVNGTRYDIFLRDLQAGTTRLVTARPDGNSGNADADTRNQGELALSADGRYVAFVSSASDLVAGDNNGPQPVEGQDVFVRDTVAGTTQLVSVNKAGTGSGAGPSASLALTPDGRFVAFVSAADDLVANDTNKLQDVFVRDTQAGTTTLVTVNTGGTAGGIQSLACGGSTSTNADFPNEQRPSPSADGRYVAFRSAAADLTSTPDTNCFTTPTFTQVGYDIFVRDTQAGSTRLVSVNRTGEAAAAPTSQRPSITPDGRHILFNSFADDLVGNDTSGPLQDAYVNVNLVTAGQVRFAQHVFQASESAGQATVSVTRTPGATGAATVSYTTLGSTAQSGSEFTPTSGTLTFAPGEESKQFTVPIFDDHIDEADESVYLRITDGAAGSIGEPSYAAVLIVDDDPLPRLSVSDARVGEGDSGAPEVTFLVTLSDPSTRLVTASFATQAGTATPGSDYDHFQDTYLFPPGATRGLLKVRVRPDTLAEADETFNVVFSNPTNAEIADGVGVGTIVDDDGSAAFTKVRLAATDYTVSESAGRLDVPLTRTGDLSAPSSVGYYTADFQASGRTDYTASAGVLKFAAGESSKTLTVFVTDDALREDDESFFLVLYAPDGCTLGAPSFATVVIKSDDAANGASPAGPQGDTAFFVRQHYRDFLGRDPDASGLAFWTNEIDSCGANAACREVKRVNVSAAFFLSIEFQETGYLAYRTYKAAYGNGFGAVPISFFWFLHDAQQIGRGVVVNQGDWRGQLEQNKREYFDYFVRDEFFNLVYPATLTPEQFVGALDTNAGGVLTAGERASLVAALAAGTKTRAEVLRAVAENQELSRRELNRAFVLMQYFGYLRRSPNDFPDFDFSGYNFWLGKLEEFKGNYIAAEMVKAFIQSDEYVKRFGQ